MRRTNEVGGIGGIAFAVLTVVAFFISSPPGGNYVASDAATFVSPGHRAAAFVAGILVFIAVIGLLCLLATLRRFIRTVEGEGDFTDSMFWGMSVAATTSWIIGWAAMLSLPIAYAQGGSAVALSSPEIYVINQVGDTILYGAAGMLLGVALIALALGARATLPSRLWWLTLIIGILGLASAAFFPWFLLLIWGLIMGGWLLVARDPTSSERV